MRKHNSEEVDPVNAPAIATPPANNITDARAPGVLAYQRITEVDPAALPDAVIRLAQATQDMQAALPAKNPTAPQAAAEYAAAVAAAARTGGKPPAIASVAEAVAVDQAADAVRRPIIAAWQSIVADIGPTLAKHGDEIVAVLQRHHDEAVAQFLAAVDTLGNTRDEVAILHAPEATQAAYHAAGHAVARFAAVRAARSALDNLKGYRADTPHEQGLIQWRTPRQAQDRLPRETLDRWRLLAVQIRRAGAWCPTRAEAEERHAELVAAVAS